MNAHGRIDRHDGVFHRFDGVLVARAGLQQRRLQQLFAPELLAQERGHKHGKEAQHKHRQSDGYRDFAPGGQALALVIGHADEQIKVSHAPQRELVVRIVAAAVGQRAHALL